MMAATPRGSIPPVNVALYVVEGVVGYVAPVPLQSERYHRHLLGP